MDPCARRAAPPGGSSYLESAAGLVEDGVIGYDTDPAETPGLPDALRRDAELLRTLADGAR